MAEYFSFQAALLFSIAHVFVRRGLVHSNGLTGSLISVGISALVFWLLALFLVPLSTLWMPGIGYFVAAGFFAPAIGQTLAYIGMERIGVARAAPIVNTSPIFSSMFAVFFLDEVWLLQNMIGTCLVIAGVIVLSWRKTTEGAWRKKDLLYPGLGAVVFGISTTLRKAGITEVQDPLLAAAVTVGTAFFVLLAIVRIQGGRRVLTLNPQGNRWLVGAALVNAGAILSFFSALNVGDIVRVEPLVACNPLLTILWTGMFLRQIEAVSGRIVLGAFITVVGTVLVVTAA